MGGRGGLQSVVATTQCSLTRGNRSDMKALLVSPSPSQVRVLEADPDLAAGLKPDQLHIAAQRVYARTEVLDAGLWEPRPSNGTCLGLLILEGLICRSVAIVDRSSTELLGAGDLLRPWRHHDEDGMLPCRVEWRVLERARVVILDERFSAAIAPWPEIAAELAERAIRRSRWQAVFATISHMTRVDVRLLFAFWHFADRWGRVTPDGVVVRLPLTHESLGTLIGARRPSVTTALSGLAQRGLLRPLIRGEWLLTGGASARLEAMWAGADAAVAA